MAPSDPRKPPMPPKAQVAKTRSAKPAPTAGLGDDDDEATVLDPGLHRRMKALVPVEEDPAKLPFPVPSGWGLNELSPEDFWRRVVDMEKARIAGADALDLALSAYELQSYEHFSFLRERFEQRHGDSPAFQAARKTVLAGK